MSHMISKSGPFTLAILLASALSATQACAAAKAAMPMHAKQHMMKAMHTRHHGMSMDHRKHHMVMMQQHGKMTDSQHKAMMKKMHAMHHREMAGPAMHVAMMPPKQAGACGTYMYWKAGGCLDARNKK